MSIKLRVESCLIFWRTLGSSPNTALIIVHGGLKSQTNKGVRNGKDSRKNRKNN